MAPDNQYTQYVAGFVKLLEDNRPDPLKEVIMARVQGKTEPIHGLISPSYSRDEGDENAIYYYIYRRLEKKHREKELMVLRGTICELLMGAFIKKENLRTIDALGQMAGYFQVKECPEYTEQLRLQMWAFLNTRLGEPPLYTPFSQMMLLNPGSLEYAWRAFDLWLTVTPIFPHDRDAKYYEEIIDLFQNVMKHQEIITSTLHFRLLTLIFRALLKVLPSYAGKSAFLKVCRLVRALEKESSSSKHYLHGWYGLCHEWGVLFKYDKTPGKKWREEFKEGIIDRMDSENSPREDDEIFWESLRRMDDLKSEIKKIFHSQGEPIGESGNVIDLMNEKRKREVAS